MRGFVCREPPSPGGRRTIFARSSLPWLAQDARAAENWGDCIMLRAWHRASGMSRDVGPIPPSQRPRFGRHT